MQNEKNEERFKIVIDLWQRCVIFSARDLAKQNSHEAVATIIDAAFGACKSNEAQVMLLPGGGPLLDSVKPSTRESLTGMILRIRNGK
jgi:hypothetical protein